MSSDLETALAEYSQDLPDRPGTFCRYDVTVGGILDLRDQDTCAVFGIAPTILGCQWKQILLIEKAEPPTWPIVDRLRASGASGALVPSQRRPQGHNLVLWVWAEDTVRPFDPNNDLPLPV